MAPHDDLLDHLRIATPCQREWEGMTGDERVRHCTSCDRKVYDVAAMTRDEIAQALGESEGRLCARLTRRSDGTLVTRDAAPPRPMPRSRAATAAGAMLLSSVALAAGCASGAKAPPPRLHVRMQLERAPAAAAAASSAAFEGVVRMNGSPRPGVAVTLRNEVTRAERSVVSNAEGAFRVDGLSDGFYAVEMQLDGLERVSVTLVFLRRGEVTRASAIAELQTGQSVLLGEVISVPAVSHDALSTKLPQDIVNKLPI